MKRIREELSQSLHVQVTASGITHQLRSPLYRREVASLIGNPFMSVQLLPTTAQCSVTARLVMTSSPVTLAWRYVHV